MTLTGVAIVFSTMAGEGGEGGWIGRSRPDVRINSIYVNNNYRNISVNRQVVNNNVNYNNLNRYNGVHRK